MIFNILIYISILFTSYLAISQIADAKIINKLDKYLNEKSDKYYEELLKYHNKNKKVKIKVKLNLLHKINFKIEKANLKRNAFINPITIIVMSIFCFIISYFGIFNFLKIIFLSIIISTPSLLIPIVILDMIGGYKTSIMEKAILNFLLQLKNYTKINNDIVYAMSEVKTVEPLQSYINTFLIQIGSGIKFENAIEDLKEKINIDVFKNFLTHVEHCYLYGGNFTKLLDRSYKMIEEIQKEKKNRIQETKSARLALFILIFLDIIVYVVNIKNESGNFAIMKKTVLGNLILYWNFISMGLLVLLANKVKKLDY